LRGTWCAGGVTQAETTAARNTLKEAEAEMDAIHFEKKQLVQQWKSSLIGISRRDEALQATEEALRKQHEQEASIVTEMQGYRRALKEVQATNESVTGLLKKVSERPALLRVFFV
jgi:chromosome segregation ATPase